MAATMRAAVLPGVDAPLELRDVPLPEPGLGQARVRIEACGVCGSDLFLQRGGFGAEKLPLIPGHEAAGTVDAVGPGVDQVEPGDQVALYYIDADPAGAWARAGRENLDPSLKRMGVDVDGAFAEYVVRSAHTLIRPPAEVDPPALAVLTDAVATPHHALRLAGLRAGETVLVLGVGGIGSNAVQLAHHAGARVVAASRSAEKLTLASELGADRTISLADGGEPADRLREPFGGFDVVVQCAGSARLDELAIDCAGPGGRVVLVGATSESFRTRSVDLIWRELHVMGSRGFTRADVVDVLRLHCEGAVRVDHLTARTRPLEEADDALADLRDGRTLRTVLLPGAGTR